MNCDTETMPNLCSIACALGFCDPEGAAEGAEGANQPFEQRLPESELLLLEARLSIIRPDQTLLVAEFLSVHGQHEDAVRIFQLTQTLANEQAKGPRDAAAMRLMRDAIQGKERSLVHLGREDEIESARATAAFLTRIIDASGF